MNHHMVSSILIIISCLDTLQGMFNSERGTRCTEEILLERRENVTGREFCLSPWDFFSCPSDVTEETVNRTETVTRCCPGYGEDTDGQCHDDNLLYLLVIVPLITLVILILVLIYCICKMKAKLRLLRETKTRKPSQESEKGQTKKYEMGTEGQTTVNNPIYYQNSGFCTISEKIQNQDSPIKIALHKG